MNIFIFDYDYSRNVKQYCDKHVVKMILEHTQMLSTVCRENGISVGYKSTHKNHPCTKWVNESLSNWKRLRDLTIELHKEWQYRFDHVKNHKSFDVMMSLPEPNIPDIGYTKYALAMPDKYKNTKIVTAYRDYFIGEKQHLSTWSKRKIPSWFTV